jgi:ABC-2 type transport system ATP-binding protein
MSLDDRNLIGGTRVEAAPALTMREVRKAFGKPAVDGLNLRVKAGEFYALLGPNAAGKTTTLRLAAGLLVADSGTIEVFGIDVRRDPIEAKRVIAWLPDEPMLYDRLDPLEYLEFVAGLWGIEPVKAQKTADDLLETLGLWPHRHQRCETLSRGMKQKVALAGALVHEPKLLMLDEPLIGLDAASSRQVKNLLAASVRQGASIILTTHILEVAERLADRIGIIDQGRLIAEGTLEELKGSVGRVAESLEDLFLELTDGSR